MDRIVSEALEKVLSGSALGAGEALRLSDERVDFDDLLYAANKIRKTYVGQRVHFCSIVNARSGACSEDCAFCAQSAKFKTGAPVYALMQPDQVLEAAKQAQQNGAQCFGIVISGRGVRDRDLDRLCALFEALRPLGIRLGGSLGILNEFQARRLAAAGMRIINHNLETSRRMFPAICTTHTYDERLATLDAARRAGMLLCAGGIFGMGETWEDRVDMLNDLQVRAVDSLPLNFLNPIPGTPLASQPRMSAREILRSIAIARFMLPRAEIRICGGREVNLRDLQSWMFHAGASGTLIGNYLTTLGRSPAADWQMVVDLGLADAASVASAYDGQGAILETATVR